ncbi:hypothetical protein Ga0100231_009175 [Opitutaceae bacterium TAV4]|nr:hypothetical protein Ga0100231_008960 [Opitutaceae bacterium TAV4]RRJ94493.1 hypothetical protein Ga0100231_009175 [Opitutaceae bacterium TAV4]RRJ98554.1 hypothetical protein Ga0100230_009265 [Opitutaceae bacterium TAV3]
MFLVFTIISFLVAIYLARRLATPFHPFCMALAGWGLVNGVQALSLIRIGGLGSLQISIKTVIAIALVTAGVACIFLITKRPPYIASYSIHGGGEGRFRSSFTLALMLSCLMLVLYGFAQTLRMTGGALPITSISGSFSMGRGMDYADVIHPSMIWGWCANRLMWLWLAFDITEDRRGVWSYLKSRIVPISMALLATALCVSCGLRSIALWPVLIMLAALGLRPTLELRRNRIVAAVSFLAFGLFFMLYGAFRFGSATASHNPFEAYIAPEIQNSIVRSITGWLVAYGGTSIPNLDALIQNPPAFDRGSYVFSAFLPGSIVVRLSGEQPTAIGFLTKNKLMPIPGLTFRTALADYIPSMGLLGSIILLLVCVLLAVIAHNLASSHAPWRIVYFSLIPGIVYFPFKDEFLTRTSFLPLIAALLVYKLFCLMGGPVRPIRSRISMKFTHRNNPHRDV